MKKSKTLSKGCLTEAVQNIAQEHPTWGYRRVAKWIQKKEGVKISLKEVYQIMKDNALLNSKTQIQSYPSKVYIELPSKDKFNSLILYFQ